jgi:hypothetical protein
MRTVTIFSLMLVLGLAAVTSAQPYQGPIAVGGTSIQTLTLTGTQKYVYNNPGYAHGVTMDLANQQVLYSADSSYEVFSVDPTTGAVTTIKTGFTGLAAATECLIDQNGDHVVVGSSTGYPAYSNMGLFRISGSTLSTVITTLQMGIAATFTGGLEIDIDTGNYIAQMYGGSSGPHPLVSISPNGGVFTTVIANFSSLGGPRFQFAQDIRTGKLYVGGNNSSLGFLVEVDKKTGISKVVATNGNDRYAWNVIHADRGSSSLPQLISSYTRHLYFTDLKGFSVTSVATSSSAVSPRSMEIIGSRNLQTVATGSKQWNIQVSCPNHPSKAYVLGMSLSGIRPGVTLKDGRSILLNPDWLTILTVTNKIPGIFGQGAGLLDTNGTAVGKLNLSGLPKLNVVGHIAVIVLDAKAPLGIALIPDPVVMQL